MKKIVKVKVLSGLCILLLFSTTLTSCMWIKYRFVSPGRVLPDSLTKHNQRYDKVSEYISCSATNTFETIGHGCGSWKYYPMKINRKGKVHGNETKKLDTTSRNVITLIDNSIRVAPHMSIELDAQYVPPKHHLRSMYPNDGAYVIHDIPKWCKKRTWSSEASAYFHQNRIDTVMQHIVNHKYYETCKVYIEIKVKKRDYDSTKKRNCKVQCIELANQLNRYIKDYKTQDGNNWMCITSFSPLALLEFRKALPDELKDKVDYVLIAGHDVYPPKSWIAQSKGYVPKLKEKISNYIYASEWLDCIWFSVQGIKHYNEVFEKINEKRAELHPQWKPLEYSYSTYQYKPKKMTKKMLKDAKRKILVRSYMLDLYQ